MDPQIKPPTEKELACVAHLKSLFTIGDLDADDTHFLNESTYLRFARARDASIEKATELLRECMEWRRSYKPQTITEADVSDILQLGTVYMAGVCKAGRPVMYMTPGAENPFPASMRVKLMVFLLEETHRRGHTALTWVFDFSKLGKRGKDEHSAVTRKETMHILQNYYPERLGALYMINTPWYFRALATIVWPFIDKRTREKIFLSAKANELPQHIDATELVEAFGGQRRLVAPDGHRLEIAALVPQRVR